MPEKILLGFSVPKGEPIYVPLHHLAIFGMTQLSGKTTTLEALISRSGLKAVAFKTKRGETGFHEYNNIPAYYKPRSDWQFVEGLVNVALGEKVKYEAGMRWAIMKVSKGTHDLPEVQSNVKKFKKEARGEFQKAVFEKLDAYLDIVIPELEHWSFSEKLDLNDGVNVMDLTNMKLETQQLVIASTIQYAFQNLSNIVVIIPEAWEMIPEMRMTPVKWVAEQFIRKGASVGNFLWIDSQDIGGVSKVPLRQCDNWLMGRMKEAHEVERILKQLLGLKIPKEEIQTLELGHFYAVIGDKVVKTYVLPVGVPEAHGRDVALGILPAEKIRDEYLKPKKKEEENLEMQREVEILRKMIGDQQREIIDLKNTIQLMNAEYADLHRELEYVLKEAKKGGWTLKEDLGKKPKEEPTTIDLEHRELVVNLIHVEKPVEMNTDIIIGKIMFCMIKDLEGDLPTEEQISNALLERGWNIGHTTLAPTLGGLVRQGYIIRIPNTKPSKYRMPTKLKINVKEEKP